MLWTPAVTLWFAAAMSYPADMFTDAPGAASPEAAYLWGPPQLDDDRDDVLAPRVGRSGIGAARELLEPDADMYARLDRGKIGNFVRLGRAGGGRLDASFLRLGRGPADGFIRLGRDRAAQNYIRLGRDRLPAAGFDDEEEDASMPPRQTRGGQAGTPRIRSRKADASDGDLVAPSGGPRRDADGFQRARRTGASSTFGRGKLTDSNFIRLGRGGARVARSADGKENNDEDDDRVGYGAYPPLAADLPTYILGPELSLLPQPSHLALAANTKREKNYIRFG